MARPFCFKAVPCKDVKVLGGYSGRFSMQAFVAWLCRETCWQVELGLFTSFLSTWENHLLTKT